jgi:hypothetical protein
MSNMLRKSRTLRYDACCCRQCYRRGASDPTWKRVQKRIARTREKRSWDRD